MTTADMNVNPTAGATVTCHCGDRFRDPDAAEKFLAHNGEKGCRRRPWRWWPRKHPWLVAYVAFVSGVLAQIYGVVSAVNDFMRTAAQPMLLIGTGALAVLLPLVFRGVIVRPAKRGKQ